MKFSVLTLQPEIYLSLNYSVLGKALNKGIFQLDITNIRDYSEDKHKKCDDSPYGGGAGMLMTPQPIHSAICSLDPNHLAYRIYLSPKGEKLNQNIVKELSKKDWLLLLNGSFEGIDERIIDLDIDREISIGDYILTSGDYASLVLINAVSRYIPGVLGSEVSNGEESFSEPLLEYPQYTRPQDFLGKMVPDVLINGNHQEIKEWRKKKSIEITKMKRPDLMGD
jgi:tRNA (guanine37-N1)-methyltransferase